ncbi:MAG: DNA methyltransferase [Lutibacter sp.]
MSKFDLYNSDYRLITPLYPDKYFNLAVCDIPYGIDVANMPYLKEMNTTVKQRNGNRLNGNKNKQPHEFKDWDKEAPPQEYFDELRRISKEQIIFGVDYVNWTGLKTGRIIWDKGFAEGMSFGRYEVAYCSLINYEMTIPLLWAGMMQAKSLNEPIVQQGNKKLNEKRIHPCHKPVLLYKKIFQLFAKPNMNIIDTHLGGGSILIAADDFGLNMAACEIDKEYFDAACKRLDNHKRQLTLW